MKKTTIKPSQSLATKSSAHIDNTPHDPIYNYGHPDTAKREKFIVLPETKSEIEKVIQSLEIQHAVLIVNVSEIEKTAAKLDGIESPSMPILDTTGKPSIAKLRDIATAYDLLSVSVAELRERLEALI